MGDHDDITMDNTTLATCPLCEKEIDTTFGNFCEHCGYKFDGSMKSGKAGAEGMPATGVPRSIEYLIESMSGPTMPVIESLDEKISATGGQRPREQVVSNFSTRASQISCSRCGMVMNGARNTTCPECKRQVLFFEWKGAWAQRVAGVVLIVMGVSIIPSILIMLFAGLIPVIGIYLEMVLLPLTIIGGSVAVLLAVSGIVMISIAKRRISECKGDGSH